MPQIAIWGGQGRGKPDEPAKKPKQIKDLLGLVSGRPGPFHTALVGSYAIEGHVPAADIQRLLKERPDAIGLAVPGMPHGSPGMDGPAYGNRQDAYDVLLIGQDGSTRVFSSDLKPRRKS